jgi:hypothetical protein
VCKWLGSTDTPSCHATNLPIVLREYPRIAKNKTKRSIIYTAVLNERSVHQLCSAPHSQVDIKIADMSNQLQCLWGLASILVKFSNTCYTALFNDAVKLAQQCFPTTRPWFPLFHNNDPDHAGCLPPRKNATNRQTDMDESIRCSSLMLEREEHLKSDKKSVSIMTTSHLKMGVEPTPKMLCISSTSQTTDDVQHSTHTVTTVTLKVLGGRSPVTIITGRLAILIFSCFL